MANSPSAEAVGVGKADSWLTTFRARRWKRTKRPTDFGAILKYTVSGCPGRRYILAAPLSVVWFPPPEEKCWTCGQLRSGPAGRWCWSWGGTLRPGTRFIRRTRRGGAGQISASALELLTSRGAETRSPLYNYNQISREALQAPCEIQHHLPRK